MVVKLIAVDMDGTFLDDKHTYNKVRFQKLYKKMKNRKIKFVVASGNQYYQLRSHFPDIHEEISFVAENGAYIIEETKEISSNKISKEIVETVIKLYKRMNEPRLIICGKKSAYIHINNSEAFFAEASLYYKRLKKISSLEEIDDTILKFSSLISEDRISKIIQTLSSEINEHLIPTSSGQGYVDLIIPGIHKGAGIKLLQNKWNISNAETMAFGDSGNDFEMLKQVKYSYAMGNASNLIKQSARYQTLSNNNEGVLEAIEDYLSTASF